MGEDFPLKNESPSCWWHIFNFIPDPIGEFSFILFLIFIAVVIVLGLGIWIGIEGPIVLIDAAFDVALSVGLVECSHYLFRGDWFGGVLARTCKPFLLILLVGSGVMYGAHKSCPDKDRLSAIVRECWKSGHN